MVHGPKSPAEYARSHKVVTVRRVEAGVYHVFLTADGHYEGGNDFGDARTASAFAKKVAADEGATIKREGFKRS